MNTKKLLVSLASVAAVTAANAVSVSFSAINTSGVGDSSGNDLAIGSAVELGIWSGASFTALNTFDLVDGDFGAETTTGAFASAGAFQAATDNIDTTGLGIANSQLAIRWTQGDGGFGIAYSTSAAWQLLAGDGSGSDTGTNVIDLSDLVGPGDVLDGNTVIEVGSFGGTSVTFGGTQMFQAAPVPEPSTYAALSGLLALGYVMVRRRK